MPKLENKGRILKATREKCQLIYKGKDIRITSDLSAQTLKVRKARSNIIQTLRANNSPKEDYIQQSHSSVLMEK
jgi:hypothetical protein